MNYPQTLNKAKTLLRQRHYAQAVQTAASALENVMADPYQVVIQPLVEEGAADVQLRLHLEARSEIDVNLIDLSVKESVQQFNREAEVRVA